MRIPAPEVGLVISYSYLWKHKAKDGLEEGRKDQPCVVMAVKDNHVVVIPITDSPPARSEAVELPQQVKKNLGLDHEKSWLITNEANYFEWRFEWPSVDVRPVKRKNSNSMVYGKLSPSITSMVKKEIYNNAQSHSLDVVSRDIE